MSDNIPEDVIVSILTKLPAKSLLRFRCVSKAWQGLITSSTFIDLHLSTTTISNNLLIVRRGIERYFLYPGEHFPQNSDKGLHCPLRSSYNSYLGLQVVGVCHGVVCMCDEGPKYVKVALWNPSIRRTILLPDPNITFKPRGKLTACWGFGHDSSSNDYKVVRLVDLSGRDIDHGRDPLPPLAEVYSLKCGRWQMVPNDVKLNFDSDDDKASVCLNGACHWLARSWDPLNKVLKLGRILSFDWSGEVFVDIPVPDCVLSSCSLSSVGVFDGCLTLLPSLIDNPNLRRFPIWVMKEYGVVESWTKLLTVDVRNHINTELGGLRGNGEILFVTVPELFRVKIFSYDPKSKEFSDCYSCIADDLLYGEGLEESLVLANEENGVWDLDAYASNGNATSINRSTVEADGEGKEKNEEGLALVAEIAKALEEGASIDKFIQHGKGTGEKTA
ncbi:hypothetical protein Tsubulata_029349 [Turnera subulata]|uniref:F-box domain-containing protein n=1 Tax=Turnera subulata TaxID=218843 RepID=A0A9Q0JDQ2_9ROSI|nr:hypothetical protein Tsubulata_029349 [Turnera subulata]